MRISRSNFEAIAAFFCFVPYISFVPMRSDIQPLALAIVSFYLLWLRKIEVNRTIVAMFVYVVLSVALINSSSIRHVNQYFILFVSYLAFPVICLFGYNYQGDLLKVLRRALVCYLLFALVQVFSPSFFKDYVSLIYNQKVIETGVRGWSSITPEPTDLAFTCSIIIGILLIKLSSSKVKKSILCSLVAGLLLVAGSLGISGFLTTFAVFLIYFITSNFSKVYKIGVISSFLLLFLWVLILLEGTRVSHVIIGLMNEPMHFISNTSLFYRVFENHLALFYTYKNSFVPAGFNAFYDAVKSLEGDKFIFLDFYYNRSAFISSYFASPPEFAKNVFSRSLIENGFISVLFLVSFIFSLFFQTGFKVFGILMVMFLLYIAQSFPIYYPPIWFALGYFMNEKNSQLHN